MNKQEALNKIEELKKFVAKLEVQDGWVKIDYSVIPKETFEKYGAKPFEIMKRKVREDGKVVNNIVWDEAKEKAKELGYHLPTIQEMLVLLDAYKKLYPDNADVYHKEFLGIEELSCGEDVFYEWVDAPTPSLRGATWNNGSGAGAFSLTLAWGTGNTAYNVGFRLSRDIK